MNDPNFIAYPTNLTPDPLVDSMTEDERAHLEVLRRLSDKDRQDLLTLAAGMTGPGDTPDDEGMSPAPSAEELARLEREAQERPTRKDLPDMGEETTPVPDADSIGAMARAMPMVDGFQPFPVLVMPCQRKSDDVGELWCDPDTAVARLNEVDGMMKTVDQEYKEAVARDGSADRPRTPAEKAYTLELSKLVMAWYNTVYMPWLTYYKSARNVDTKLGGSFDCPDVMLKCSEFQARCKVFSESLAKLTGRKPTIVISKPPVPKPGTGDKLAAGFQSMGTGAAWLACAVVFAVVVSKASR